MLNESKIKKMAANTIVINQNEKQKTEEAIAERNDS
ncbi:MAG: hypothetical protein MRERC_1c041 [Mycoplasmataceae bacterium RC_NB112A]|nr:MAG: hypothetical protein MRERC_1c041 [Mycoplasmataceae bacterium RC_NB112A]